MTRKDFTQTAFDVFKQATGEQPKQPSPAPKPETELAKNAPKRRQQIKRARAK
jgi:hypothetical protein